MSSLDHASRRAVLGLLATASLVAACGGDQAPPQGPGAVPVTVVTLAPQTVTLTRELPGRTHAFLVAEVRPQVDGIVKQRLYTEGATVRAGQPLYQLDDATYRAEYASAKAALARAEATLNTARLNARRSADLVAINAVSQQEDENAVAALQAGRGRRRGCGGRRAARRRDPRLRAHHLAHHRADRQVVGHAGRAGDREPGRAARHRPAARSGLRRPGAVERGVPGTAQGHLGRPHRGRQRPAREDRARGRHAARRRTASSRSPTSRSIRAPAASRCASWCRTRGNVLLPGMYVRALVGSGVRENALLVPQQGIARDPKGHTTAMVVGPDGKAEVRPVRVSWAIGDKWLVEDGLAAGDKVIVEGLQKIQPGAPVAGHGGRGRAARRPAAGRARRRRRKPGRAWHASSSTGRSSPGSSRSSSCSRAASRSRSCRSPCTRTSRRPR